jgi:hypothetical protein
VGIVGCACKRTWFPGKGGVKCGAFTHSACFTTDWGFAPRTEGLTFMLIDKINPTTSMAKNINRVVTKNYRHLEKDEEVTP